MPSVGTLAVGKPSSRPRSVAADHDAADGVGAAQRLGGAGHVAGRQAGADVRRRPDHRTAVQRDPLGVEPVRRRRTRCSVATSPAALLPNRKLAPTTTAAACTASTSTRWANSSGRPRGHVAVERQRQDVVGARLRQQPGPDLDRGQLGRRVLGPQHRHRVRVEGDRHDRQAPRWSAISRARASTCWWPRWTPSKLPITTTDGPRSAGTSSSERQICTATTLGLRRRRPRDGRAPRAARRGRGTRRRARRPRSARRAVRRAGGRPGRRRPRPRRGRPTGTPPARRRRSAAASKSSASWSRVRATSRP